VSTSTRSSRFVATSSKSSISPFHISPVTAFFFSGRFSVHVTIPSARSTSKESIRVTVAAWDSTRSGNRSSGAATSRSSRSRCWLSCWSCCGRRCRDDLDHVTADHDWTDHDWTDHRGDESGQIEVRHVQPYQADKMYRCPGCDHEIRPGEGHKVVIPLDA